ncbi:hypothetical protein ABH999_000652 [Bradyrhizobium yuanmingense]
MTAPIHPGRSAKAKAHFGPRAWRRCQHCSPKSLFALTFRDVCQQIPAHRCVALRQSSQHRADLPATREDQARPLNMFCLCCQKSDAMAIGQEQRTVSSPIPRAPPVTTTMRRPLCPLSFSGFSMIRLSQTAQGASTAPSRTSAQALRKLLLRRPTMDRDLTSFHQPFQYKPIATVPGSYTNSSAEASHHLRGYGFPVASATASKIQPHNRSISFSS